MTEPATQMPVTDARDHISDVVSRASYAGQETILTRHGIPVAAVISIAEYQVLKKARGDSDSYDLPPDIMAIIEEGRAHPERSKPRPRRHNRGQQQG